MQGLQTTQTKPEEKKGIIGGYNFSGERFKNFS